MHERLQGVAFVLGKTEVVEKVEVGQVFSTTNSSGLFPVGGVGSERRGKRMKKNAQLMAMIHVDSVEQAREFYVERLGFTHMMGMLGKDGQLDFCTVSREGARIMLIRPSQGMTGTNISSEKRPVELYIEVGDVEDYFEQVRQRKVKVATPLTEQWWGDRTFTIQDPFGYTIWFYQNFGEPVLPAGAKVV